jgi:hypothetical protein
MDRKPTGDMAALDAVLAPEFDPAFYRDRHADLASFSDADLLAHYEKHGRSEGRWAAPLVTRSAFVEGLRVVSALEIGPFFNPSLTGPDVRYLDICSTDELKERARSSGLDPTAVPPIDYVSPPDRLDTRGQRFPLVFSSHVIEHQPDLIHHLQEVEVILLFNGAYALVVPDCRYCFDHFIAPSNIAEVIGAYEEKRRRHTLANYVEHSVLTTHNDPLLHWKGEHGEPQVDRARIQAAVGQWRAAKGAYLDVHAWQFTPASFRQIILGLYDLGLTKLKPLRVYDTPCGNFEFCAVLTLSSDEPGA